MSSATPISLTRTPTSPTSAKASPFSASIPTHPDRSGTYPTTPTRAPPVSSVNSSSSAPAPRGLGCVAIPPSLLRLAALTNPTVRELLEMQYQFAEPFIVDSTKIDNVLDVHATPIEQARRTPSPPTNREDPDHSTTPDPPTPLVFFFCQALCSGPSCMSRGRDLVWCTALD